MKYTYTPHGVCSRQIELEVEDVIKRLKGIDCAGKGTSCPDQIAKALEEILK